MAAIEPVNCATGDAPLCPVCREERGDCGCDPRDLGCPYCTTRCTASEPAECSGAY